MKRITLALMFTTLRISVQADIQLDILNRIVTCSKSHDRGSSPYNSFYQLLNCIDSSCHNEKLESKDKEVCNEQNYISSTCGRVQVGSVDKGKSGAYLPNLSCDWIITGTPGHIFNITFGYFDLEYSKSDCIYDYFAIYDSKQKEDLTGKLCGKIPLPMTLYSRSNQILFHFSSDSFIHVGAVEVAYQELPLNENVSYFKQYLAIETEYVDLSSKDKGSIAMIHHNVWGSIAMIHHDVWIHKWLIRSRIGTFMVMTWNIILYDEHTNFDTSLQVFDGPRPISHPNELLYTKVNQTNLKRAGTLISDTFQVFVIFKHSGSSELNINVKSHDAPACRLSSYGVRHISPKLNRSDNIYLKKDLSRICPDSHIKYSYLEFVILVFDKYELIYDGVKDPYYHIYEIGIEQYWVLIIDHSPDSKKQSVFEGPNNYDCSYGGIVIRDGLNTVFGPFCLKGFTNKRNFYKRCKGDTQTSVIVYSSSGFFIDMLHVTVFINEEPFYDNIKTFCPKTHVWLDPIETKSATFASENKTVVFEDGIWQMFRDRSFEYLKLHITSNSFGDDVNDFVIINGLHSSAIQGRASVITSTSFYVYTYAIINRIDCLNNQSLHILYDTAMETPSPQQLEDGWVFTSANKVVKLYSVSYLIQCSYLHFEFGIWMAKSFNTILQKTLPFYLSGGSTGGKTLSADVQIPGSDDTVSFCYYIPGLAKFSHNRFYYIVSFGTLSFLPESKNSYYDVIIYPDDSTEECDGLDSDIKFHEYYGCSKVRKKTECLISVVNKRDSETGKQTVWRTISTELVEAHIMAEQPSNIWKKHKGFSMRYEYSQYQVKKYNKKELCNSQASHYFSGHCYSIHTSNTSFTWKEASMQCKRNGGNLLSIKSHSELDFIRNMLATSGMIGSITTGIWFIGLQASDSVSRM